MQITKPGLYDDLPEHIYHSDPYGDSLSSTEAKEILKSPAHLHHYRTTPREPKPVFDLGSAVHTLALGTGWPIYVSDYGSWRSKDAQVEAEGARAEGKIPLLRKDHDAAQRIAEAVREHPIAGPLFEGRGRAEVSMFGQHESGVKLRGRCDWITEGGIIVDLKTAMNPDPAEFARTAYTLSYDLQAAHYELTYQLATGQRPRGFIHVLVGKEEPNLVAVVQLDDDFLEIGRQKLHRAIARYKHALDTDEWGGYPNIIHSVSPQNWMIYAQEDAEEAEEKRNQ